jgi:hypothetical protein
MKKFFNLIGASVLAFAVASCSNEEGSTLERVNTRAVTVITDNVTSSTTWSGEIELANKIAVEGQGVTLTIQPGTIIRGRSTGTPQDATALIITKGAKIHAVGTSSNPIVMTAKNGQRGGWGGLVILGKAPVNQPQPLYIEGIVPNSLSGVDTSYGGSDPDDDSGILQYVRVEYAGATIGLNNELNSFTLGGVGRGTTIDHCQAYYGDDDGFEFFGGTVNADHLVAIGTTDDSFDFDFGYSGTIQFAVSTVASVGLTSDPNGIECDNENPYTGSTPYTHPVLSNLTIIGSTSGTSLKSAANFRRGTQFTLVNSVLYGFPTGILLQDINTNPTPSSILKSNVICSTTSGQEISGLTSAVDASGNSLVAVNGIQLTDPWGNYKSMDLAPVEDTPAYSGTHFTGLTGLEVVTYKGAIDPDEFSSWLDEDWVR